MTAADDVEHIVADGDVAGLVTRDDPLLLLGEFAGHIGHGDHRAMQILLEGGPGDSLFPMFTVIAHRDRSGR
ncbi:hypothetical protein [Rhodospirillum rubrum]|uniref:hypothetical protein n=1 Tax=Rhodospirillum rubrum TaxID=1085 RepID=UPI00003C2D3B|nr:hypothetical protein [Rhodospirillum rubrum]AEO47344.1 hypothetical protein F11_04370 [Rhodospirillum rubrum F11]